MTRKTLALICIAFLASANAASAQNNRSFVSRTGMDSSACDQTGPCRTLARAVSVTNAFGEVVVLDSAGYGPVVITKSISLSAVGAELAITVPPGGVGISIQAGPTDNVLIVGAAVTCMAQPGSVGIQTVSAGAVFIEASSVSYCPTAIAGPNTYVRTR